MKQFVQEATHTVKDGFDSRLKDLETWIERCHNHFSEQRAMLDRVQQDVYAVQEDVIHRQKVINRNSDRARSRGRLPIFHRSIPIPSADETLKFAKTLTDLLATQEDNTHQENNFVNSERTRTSYNTASRAASVAPISSTFETHSG